MSKIRRPQEAPDRWVDDFLQHLAVDRGLSGLSQRNYAAALAEFRGWHQHERATAPDWGALRRDDFRSYLRWLGRRELSRAAVRLRFSALRTYYRFLQRRGRVEEMPLRQIALPRLGRRLPRFLTPDQMAALLAVPSAELARAEPGQLTPAEVSSLRRDAAWLETVYSCGLRVSELCRLEVQDVDFASRLVRVRGKGRKERQVPIGCPAVEAISAYWDSLPHRPVPGSPVFRSGRESSEPLGVRTVQLLLKRYLVGAGLDPALTPHKIRHSYATHLLDRGADLRSVQELLGHSHLVTTEVYTHVTTDRLQQAYRSAHPRA
jgi:integrase/recombinase XerC